MSNKRKEMRNSWKVNYFYIKSGNFYNFWMYFEINKIKIYQVSCILACLYQASIPLRNQLSKCIQQSYYLLWILFKFLKWIMEIKTMDYILNLIISYCEVGITSLIHAVSKEMKPLNIFNWSDIETYWIWVLLIDLHFIDIFYEGPFSNICFKIQIRYVFELPLMKINCLIFLTYISDLYFFNNPHFD